MLPDPLGEQIARWLVILVALGALVVSFLGRLPAGEWPLMITLAGVHYSYPDTETEVLRGIDLTVDAGQVVGVVGASGVGKTTLAKTISGFIPHSEGGDLAGRVEVDGI